MNDILISENEANQRLDKFLLKYMNKSTKSFIYKMLRKKRIKLNGKKAGGSEILCPGDNIKMYLSDETIDSFMEETQIKRKAGKLDIVFEDDNILVCNKKAGILSQPEKREDEDTVIYRLLKYLNETGQYIPAKESVFTPAICNRLDRNTSGLILCGKNLQALQALNESIRNHNIDKYYISIVDGKIEGKIILTGKLIKDSSANMAYISTYEEDGKYIQTEIEPIQYVNGFTVIKIKLVTGKTHQIRVHMKSIGHPVLGDRKYGDERLNKFLKKDYNISNQLLHAYEVVFNENKGFLGYLHNKSIVSPMPSWYNKFV